MDPKGRKAELVKQLRDAGRLQDPVARAVIELVALVADEVKERLVVASSNDMLRDQGAARELRKLHRDLTTQPPSINPTEQTNG